MLQKISDTAYSEDVFGYLIPRDPYSAGYAMVGDRFLVLLGSEAATDLAVKVWQLVDSAPGTTLSVLVAALQGAGVSAPADSVLLELVDPVAGTVAVVAAGEGSALLVTDEGPVRCGSAGTEPTRVSGVRGIGLEIAGEVLGSEQSLVLAQGMVRTNRLAWGEEPSEPPVAAAQHDVVEPRDVAPRVSAEPHLIAAETQSVAAEVQPVVTESQQTAVVDREALDELFGSTLGADPEAATFSPTLPERRNRVAVLTLADQIFSLETPTIFGRNPQPRGDARVLAVLQSPGREISQDHLLVESDGEGLLITDLDATNGTIIRLPGREAFLLRGASSVRIVAGTLLDLGDGVVLRCELR